MPQAQQKPEGVQDPSSLDLGAGGTSSHNIIATPDARHESNYLSAYAKFDVLLDIVAKLSF